MRIFRGIFKAMFKSKLRDKASLFWTLAFPLMFLVIFGLAFGSTSTTSMNVDSEETRYAIFIDESVEGSVQENILDVSGELNLKPLLAKSTEDVEKSVKEGLDGVEFGVILSKSNDVWSFEGLYDAADMNRQQLYQSLVSNLANAFRKDIAEFETIIEVEIRDRQFTKEPVTSIGYILSGVIAISITFSGLTAMIVSFGFYRKENIIKRFLATPLNGSSFLIADLLNTMIVSILSILLILVIGKLMFQVDFVMNVFYFSITFLTSMFLMMGIGGMFLLIFREPNAAMNTANIFSVIMMFFAGVYFPIGFLPNWLQVFARLLPMTYVAKNLRFALGQDFIPLSEFWLVNIIFIAIASVSIPFIGRSIFKLEKG